MSKELNIQNILLIDDNDIDQLLYSKLIEMLRPDSLIHLFSNGSTAINYITEHKTRNDGQAIIFLDIQMPIMNGFQFLDAFDLLPELIKKEYTIYMLSSSINQFDISKAKNNPYVSDMIFKPLSKDTLLKLLP